MNKPTIKLQNIAIGYPRKVVAKGINAELRAGELTCLLGPNGVGKSTLLRTLAGLQPAKDGAILVADGDDAYVDFASLKPIERAKSMSIVLTRCGDLQNMTVREIVAMGRSPYTGFWGRLSKHDEDITDRALADVGIEALASRRATTLSDGERQKAMIAKALAQQTPVIFLDEPTAFLDYPSKVETMQLLLRLCHEHGKTIFLSTHDVEIALQMADKLWVMEKGEGMKEKREERNEKGEMREEKGEVFIGTPRELAEQGVISRFIEKENVNFDIQNLTITIGNNHNINDN